MPIRTIAAVLLALAGPGAAQTNEGAMTRITVTAGGTALSAMLGDSRAARDFAAMLPLDLTLTDYHGIEKIADLPREIDTSDAPPSYEPAAGDITVFAPWGNLAIFYRPFQDSRGLVRLGQFDGPIDALLKDGEIPIHIERTE